MRIQWRAPANKSFMKLPLGFVLFRPDAPLPSPIYPNTYENWLKVLECNNGAFMVDIEKCVIFNGFSFSKSGWHPFVRTVLEYMSTGVDDYSNSFLKRYYNTWQPKDCLDALIGAVGGPSQLAGSPPYMLLAPWLEDKPEQRLIDFARIIEKENEHLGQAGLTIDDGYGLQGPVSEKKGLLEYQRLLRVFNSIEGSGYDRTYGDITAQILVRGDELRYRIVHGHHRVAVLAALGFESIAIVPTMIVDCNNVDNWTQVKEKIWNRDQALRYFNHHFDFDSLLWARQRGLV